MPRAPSPVAELLGELGSALAGIPARWYLFGAQAAILYGATRLTADVDVTVDIGSRPTSQLADALRNAGFALRVEDVDGFVARTRVLPVTHVKTGLAVDVVLAGPGLEELFFERTRIHTIDDISVPVASAEDLIAMKILAGRPKDTEDVVAIAIGRGAALDIETIRTTLRMLEQALDQSDLIPAFESALKRAGAT